MSYNESIEARPFHISGKSAIKSLALLTSVNYLNYIDRYILAAVLVSIQKDLGLTDLQAGLLATAFMVPYMFTSPIFGWLGDTQNRSKILSIGVAVWSLATLITGAAANFIFMVLSRFFLGIGESAFTVISTTYVSDCFPVHKRGRVLSILASAVPVGAALGFVLGGVLASFLGWRSAFYIVGFPGLILAYFIWRQPDPTKEKNTVEFNFKKTFKQLFGSKNYTLSVLGYCAYTFVVGGVAHWIPTYLQRTYSVDQMTANLVFGAIAVGSGFVGTVSGGYLGDWLTKKSRQGHLKISSYSMFLALPFFILCLTAENLTIFSFYLCFAQFFFFLSTSPINVAILEAAPAHCKTSAIAMSVFVCHILGDAISSPIVGFVSDKTGSLKLGLLVTSPVIVLSAFLWLMASRLKPNSIAALS